MRTPIYTRRNLNVDVLMRSPKLVVLAAVCAALPLASALAQFSGGSPGAQSPDYHLLRIGFGGGMSVPTQHAADAFKTGVNGEGFLLIDLRVLPPIRINLGYQKYDYKQLLTGQSEGGTNILSGGGGLSLTVLPLGPISAYVTAGVGAFHISDDATVAAATTGAVPSTSSIKFGIDGGAGLRLKLGRLEAFAEGKVQNVYTDQGAINRKNITSIPVAFGMIF